LQLRGDGVSLVHFAMNAASHRPVRFPNRGFTLVEIMVVVVLIGLLAALAIPAFQRVQRASQNARVSNDFRVFAQSFEIYNAAYGTWPVDGSAGVVPAGMSGDFRTAAWEAPTAIGGSWNWNNNSGGVLAGISILNYTATDAQRQSLDAKMDDGDLSAGTLQKTGGNAITLILQK
jgi:prepilin-type N-terminal cleavage/methylation domain-containing protein